MAIEISTAFLFFNYHKYGGLGGFGCGICPYFAKHKFGIFGCETPILAVKGTIVDL